MKWYQFNKKDLLLFFILSTISLLYVFPIILVNLYFKDDLGWSRNGDIGLKGDARPLGEYLVLALSGGKPVTDTAPLSFILLVLFLSYALVLYAKTNLDFVKNEYALIAILLLIITNPFAVECLTYRYGSIVMFSALSLAFLMFSIPNTMSRAKVFFYSFLLSAALMSLYQAAIGMCLILLICSLLFSMMADRKFPLLFEGIRILGIGTGSIFYKLFISSHYISRSDWRYNASQTLGLHFRSLIVILQHITDSCRYILDFISKTPLWYQIGLCLFLLSAIVSICTLYLKRSADKGLLKAAHICFFVLSPFLVLIASFLPVMLLKDLSLKPRIFIAFGGFLFYLGIFLLYYFHDKSASVSPRFSCTVLLFPLILCIFYHYVYIYSFGSALHSQKEYAEYIVYNVAHDIETINADGEFTTVSFLGEMPTNTRTQMMHDKYPLFDFMIPDYFTNDTWAGGAFVMHYLQNDLTIEADNETDRLLVQSVDPILKNSLYSCFTNGDKIIIRFYAGD